MQTDLGDDLKEMCGLLAPGRRSIYRSELSADISRALTNTLIVLLFVTLLSLGFAGAAWTGAGIGIGVAMWVLALGGIAAAVFLIGCIVRARCTTEPSLAQTAERLDLALQSLNQIATTYDLVNSGISSSFAHQQIQAGLTLLRVSGNSKPVTSPVNWNWRTNLALLSVVLMGMVIIGILSMPFGPAQSHLARNAKIDGPVGTPIQANAQERLQTVSNNRLPSTDNSMTWPVLACGELAERSESALPNPSAAVDIATAGSTGSASSKTDSVTLSNSLNSNVRSKQSAGSSAKPAPGERSAGFSAAGEPANSDKTQQNSDVQNGVSADGSSHSSGTKSDSPSPPTPSDLGNPKRETGSNGPPQNGDTDSPSSGSKSRREGQAASSNQASAAGHQDQPSHGRGDASSLSKKSRGVGSLMLGTAVPDLVMGRLSPGTSTMSRREIPPDPSNSQSTLPVDTSAHGSTVESQITRFDLLPSDSGDLASQYLIQLHSSDSAAESKTDSATGSAAPSQPSGVISH